MGWGDYLETWPCMLSPLCDVAGALGGIRDTDSQSPKAVNVPPFMAKGLCRWDPGKEAEMGRESWVICVGPSNREAGR